MARIYRRRNRSQGFEIIIGLLVLGGLGTFLLPYFNFAIDLTSVFITGAILIIFLGVTFLLFIKYQENRRFKLLQIVDVDKLSGVDFEKYVGKILESQGYGVEFTKSSGDLGVDIIATRNGERTGIQAKRYIGTVSRKAISDVVGAKNHYGYTKCMVVTTNFFTRDAKTLADSENCRLVDRTELEKWIVEFQSKRTFV